MTNTVGKDVWAAGLSAEERRDRFAPQQREMERLRDQAVVTAAVLAAAVGKHAATEFMTSKVQPLPIGTCRFYGPDGIDPVRHDLARGLDTGFCFDPQVGASFALKVKTGAGETVVVRLTPAMIATLVDEFTGVLADLWDRRALHMGYDAAEHYEGVLDALATDKLNISGKTQEIYRQARVVAQAERDAAIVAVEKAAEAKAERKVAAAVRRLAQAAAMPAGMERALLLEETRGIVNRALGGEDD